MAHTIGQVIENSESHDQEMFDGDYDDVVDWFFSVQGLNPPKLDHTRLSVFARQDRVAQDYKIVVEGKSALNALVETIDADLRLFELSSTKTGTFTERDLTLAMTYGMMNVEEGIHALALFGVKEEDEVLPVPTGRSIEECFSYLKEHGNDRLAAMVGAILAAKMGRIPVLLAGEMALVAARLLGNVDTRLVSHCLYAGLVKCEEKALLSSLAMMVVEADQEQVIAQTALSLIKHWQDLFYGEDA